MKDGRYTRNQLKRMNDNARPDRGLTCDHDKPEGMPYCEGCWEEREARQELKASLEAAVRLLETAQRLAGQLEDGECEDTIARVLSGLGPAERMDKS